MKINYEWLQTFFSAALPDVSVLEQKLMFHAYEIEGVEEINGVSVLDVDVLPNRAADSLSHRGIAHEVATLFDISMERDPLREHVELVPQSPSVQVALSDDASCSYYVAARIKGVAVGESPEWLRTRLESIGQKSINNIVDATNYVLFDLGRPTHVFDASKFAGEAPRIGTRLAREGEKMTLLGGDEVVLTSTMTVITDANDDIPVAVAGIKGGAHAAVDANTTDIIIETANFDAKQTRLTAQALKLRTDASARFENNLADDLARYGVVAVVKLILEIAGGELEGFAQAGEIRNHQTPVVVGATEVSALLGASIDTATIESILKRLESSYTLEGDVFTVTAPFERRDISIKEDVIEEIGRVYGYNSIESKQLDAPERVPHVHKKFAYLQRIRSVLTPLGVTEVYLYSLRDNGEVKLRNAFASDKDHLRSDLASGLTEALNKAEKQMPLLGLYESVQLFEIGNVFTSDSEQTHVAVGVRVAGEKKRAERTKVILDELKAGLEGALGVSLPAASGEVLEFNLDAVLEQLPELDAYAEAPTVCEGISYTPGSPYPFVLRDIAVWVPEETSSALIQEIVTKHAGELLKRSDQFDEFKKDGRISYAFHLVFQSMTETLTDEKVGSIMSAVEADIATREGWEIR